MNILIAKLLHMFFPPLEGRQHPAAPTELSVPKATLKDDNVIVQWRVPMVTYDNEAYYVIYWRDVGNQMRSSLVMGETLIHLVNVIYSVKLTGLMPYTQYSYKVTAVNSVGSQDSITRNFMTTTPREFIDIGREFMESGS